MVKNEDNNNLRRNKEENTNHLEEALFERTQLIVSLQTVRRWQQATKMLGYEVLCAEGIGGVQLDFIWYEKCEEKRFPLINGNMVGGHED